MGFSAAGTTCVLIGLAAGGQLGQRRDLQVAEYGHRDGTGDRRRGHDQHVRAAVAGLVAQGVPLLDAEPVLLVDHHQAEVGELHLLLQQRMGADHDPGAAGRGVQQRLAAGRGAQRAGQQRQPGGPFRAAELARLGERAEQRR